jgi:hypothetical protein
MNPLRAAPVAVRAPVLPAVRSRDVNAKLAGGDREQDGVGRRGRDLD